MKVRIHMEFEFPDHWLEASDPEIHEELAQLCVQEPIGSLYGKMVATLLDKELSDAFKEAAMASYREQIAILESRKHLSIEVKRNKQPGEEESQ